MKNVSVVIPTLNEEKFIGGLLESLLNQNHKPEQIIVVDGKSQDKTRCVVKGFKNRSIEIITTNPNIAQQRNLGASKVKSENIIFMDADVFPDDNFIEKLVTNFEKRNLDFACPLFLPCKSDSLVKFIYLFFDAMFIIFQKIAPSGAGTCLIAKRGFLVKQEGFKSEFKFEDAEMIRRLSRKGKFGIIPIFLKVSDRRFKKNGRLATTFKYVLLSFLFIFGAFKLANKINYSYGRYIKKH